MGTLKLAHAADESMGIRSGWVDQLKIPERPLRRDFIAQRGHAPRRAKPRGIFPPRAATRRRLAAGAGIWYTGGSLQRGGNGQRAARRA